MTVLANVMTGAFLRAKKPEVARAKAHEAIEFVGLTPKAHTPARDLTTIDQRRLEMARALATEPRCCSTRLWLASIRQRSIKPSRWLENCRGAG